MILSPTLYPRVIDLKFLDHDINIADTHANTVYFMSNYEEKSTMNILISIVLVYDASVTC